MKFTPFHWYQTLVLNRPWLWLTLFALLSALAATQLPNFKLDASADTLVLEHDAALKQYREVSKRYGGSEFVVVTYTPRERPLFDRDTLNHLDQLHHALSQVEGVSSVYSMLDVPLLFSPKTSFSSLASGYKTLRDHDVDLALAQQEFTSENPAYRELLTSRDASTTALLVTIARDEHYYTLLNNRNALSQKAHEGEISDQEAKELSQLRTLFSAYSSNQQSKTAERIAAFRTVLDVHRDEADLFLGGMPMIATDMIAFVRNDLRLFGALIGLFIIITLLVIFRDPRWVAISVLTGGVSALWLTAVLAYLDWKVTVISSNYIALLMIICLSISIYLITRYREFQRLQPDASPQTLVATTTRHMIQPSFFMVTTTMVGFGSLVLSDIRPVIDFGWMMTIGIGMTLIICYVMFPSLIQVMPPAAPKHNNQATRNITAFFAQLASRHSKALVIFSLVTIAIAAVGLARLTVENRFIDYFKDDTEIHQGMLLIDRKLGGTTPLDIVIDAPSQPAISPELPGDDDPFDDPFGDPFADFNTAVEHDPFADDFADFEATVDPFAEPSTAPRTSLEDSYWFKPAQLLLLTEIQHWLSSQPESGKVLSLATTYETAEKLNGGPLSYMQLMLLASFIPEDLRSQLVRPYLSEDGNQVRLSLRVIDSMPELKRNEYIQRIHDGLIENFDLAPEQLHLTGALVLYNNMLQSLFSSQIKSLGVVFLALLLMMAIQFKSLLVSAIALMPSLMSAGVALGFMGWIGLPLDLMTITVAAISVGIAVDDSIHYVHRFAEELPRLKDPVATLRHCHNNTGQAMYYTSMTVIAGFAILALSNFNPTIYFGLLTGGAMLIALIANLTLLPALLLVLKPTLHAPSTAVAH